MNQLDYKGRVAIITGGARGIGYAVAERMLRSGGRVSLWDRDTQRLEQSVAALSPLGLVVGTQVELTKEQDVQESVKATVEHFGKVDVLVNNAGITGGNAPT
jgi:2-dehydro-3-deoxy-L-rhamnonate dehydrogenase (NAD+)